MSRSLLRAAAPVLARPAAPALQSSRVLAGHVAALRHSPHEGAAARSLSTSAFPRAATLPAQRALWHPEYARPLSSVAAAQQAAPAAPAVPPVMDRAPPTPASQEKAPEMPPIDGAVKKPKAKRVRKALMTVSNNAVMRLTELFSEKDHPPAGIRLGVRTRGYVPSSQICSSLFSTLCGARLPFSGVLSGYARTRDDHRLLRAVCLTVFQSHPHHSLISAFQVQWVSVGTASSSTFHLTMHRAQVQRAVVHDELRRRRAEARRGCPGQRRYAR